jgi:hypothetical protein
MMVICLPLFYSVNYGQMTVLMLLQVFEILRVWVVWPFVSRRRNWIRLSLDFSLAMFFLMNLIQNTLLNTIMNGDINEMGSTITKFYGMGWAGFFLCFYFNITYIVIGVYDFCAGLRLSNREKMDAARRKYYHDKISEYENGNRGASKHIVNKWVKLGNLNQRCYGELPEINVRI